MTLCKQLAGAFSRPVALVLFIVSILSAAALITAPRALAGYVNYSANGVINYRADPGETNTIRFGYDAASDRWTITDLTAPISTWAFYCVQETASMVSCERRSDGLSSDFLLGDRDDDFRFTDDPLPADMTYTFVTVNGEDGDDEIRAQTQSGDLVPVRFAAYGGPGDDILQGGSLPWEDVFTNNLNGDQGNDTITGGPGYDTIDGGFGDDKIFGGAGDDQLSGNAGNDLIFGGPGNDRVIAFDTTEAAADALSGGPGYDRLLYAGHLKGNLKITLNSGSWENGAKPGPGDDGLPGEGDNIADDFEWLETNSSWTDPGADFVDVSNAPADQDIKVFTYWGDDTIINRTDRSKFGGSTTIDCGPGVDDASKTQKADGLISCEKKPGTSKKPNGDKKKQVITIPGLLFKFDKATLKPQAKKKLRKARKAIKGAKRVQVLGYCRPRPGEEHIKAVRQRCVKLSKQRARTVKRFLMRGLGRASRPAKIVAKGKGISMKHSARKAHLDRRVEIVLRK